MLSVDASLRSVKYLVHLGVRCVLQAILSAVKGSLMMLVKRLKMQAAGKLKMSQQPAFKVVSACFCMFSVCWFILVIVVSSNVSIIAKSCRSQYQVAALQGSSAGLGW